MNFVLLLTSHVKTVKILLLSVVVHFELMFHFVSHKFTSSCFAASVAGWDSTEVRRIDTLLSFH